MKLHKNIDELIGHAPLLELVNIEKECELDAKIIAKVEYFNPGGSVKVRIALSMINDLENKGKNLVVLLPDTGERYLSTTLFDE